MEMHIIMCIGVFCVHKPGFLIPGHIRSCYVVHLFIVNRMLGVDNQVTIMWEDL